MESKGSVTRVYGSITMKHVLAALLGLGIARGFTSRGSTLEFINASGAGTEEANRLYSTFSQKWESAKSFSKTAAQKGNVLLNETVFNNSLQANKGKMRISC